MTSVYAKDVALFGKCTYFCFRFGLVQEPSARVGALSNFIDVNIGWLHTWLSGPAGLTVTDVSLVWLGT